MARSGIQKKIDKGIKKYKKQSSTRMEALQACREAKCLVRIINPVNKQLGLQASFQFQ
jgi:hypothetical protein